MLGVVEYEQRPATSISEATARLRSLTGLREATGRGPKRALLELATALRVSARTHETNGVLGEALAIRLGTSWSPADQESTGQITLSGLNKILGLAEQSVEVRSFTPSPSRPHQFASAEWNWFRPARSKLEAVNRISNLTASGIEVLGPGGKERKSVFKNLAIRSGLDVDPAASKTELGEALALALGVEWTQTCASTGYTITLEGLNVILAGAERLLRSKGAEIDSPVSEGQMVLAILASEFAGETWDGRTCIEQMRIEQHRHWRQTEWAGWYFEYRALAALHREFGPPPFPPRQSRFLSTEFDFAHLYVWDLKAHTSRKQFTPSSLEQALSGQLLLNDVEAIDACVDQGGLGFVVLDGVGVIDETGEFDNWHRGMRSAGRSRRLASNSGRSRALKMSFLPEKISVFWFGTREDITEAIRTGALARMKQGRQSRAIGQSEGAPRPPKYQLNTAQAQRWKIGSAKTGKSSAGD